MLTRLHIPDEDKQLELVLALREAGSWGNWWNGLSLKKKGLYLSLPFVL